MAKWVKGQSGNPRGRPLGSHDFRTLLATGDELKIAQVIVERALAGEPVALRIAADRLWPALSRREVSGPDGDPIAVARAQESSRMRTRMRTPSRAAARLPRRSSGWSPSRTV